MRILVKSPIKITSGFVIFQLLVTHLFHQKCFEYENVTEFFVFLDLWEIMLEIIPSGNYCIFFRRHFLRRNKTQIFFPPEHFFLKEFSHT